MKKHIYINIETGEIVYACCKIVALIKLHCLRTKNIMDYKVFKKILKD